jgi:ElaB/YqjD/DUF883 family membrane-anchored ribosome-binding protein
MSDQPTRSGGRVQEKREEKAEEKGRRISEQAADTLDRARTVAGDTMEQAKTMARNVGEQARNIGEQARSIGEQVRSAATGATAQELTQQARDQAAAAGDMIYQQGARAGEYLTQNVKEYPFMALLIAGAIGYGIAYLIHAGWQSE